MDKSRQQFEEFIKFHMDDAEINNKFETANKGMNYADQNVDIMWISWQESRQSLEVELPKEQKAKAYDFYTDGYNSGIDCCEVRLESMGIKVIRNE